MARNYANTEILAGLIKSGIYPINEPSKKINNWSAYGIINVYNSGIGGFVSQEFTHAEGPICRRVSNDNGQTWSKWLQIDNFGYNSLADLSEGVAAQMINKDILVKRTYTLAAGEEVDTGWSSYGVYAIRTTSNGLTAIVVIGAYPGNNGILGESTTFTGEYESTTSKIFCGRKEQNGTIFIKNISTISRPVEIIQICNF